MKLRYLCTLAPVLALAVISGCATQPKPIARNSFPAAEYAALPQSGTGVVEGQVFLKTVGGDVKYGAGSEVILNPVTSYSEQWHDATYSKHAPMEPSDSRQNQYIVTTQADGSGNFRFSGVPPGKYFITSSVYWQAPSQFGLTNQGGMITNRITVSDGQTVRSILTR
ncbi:hypothetical protein C9422_21020 [Pseudomonas sp. B1(2018)]|jgi:hypothetical protein|uniref:hypothetical protein n=1 Tax=Pseudomonas sp. B1(2018) TaxID=2233856 RepID=UPI000D5D80FC|nr:hypothetical protein [Pseudomonas sp. B1(2018)]PVZ55504.1 hypothetical protein C9422_21020 [Pseudomonas sp. B1(2018)]